MSVALPASVPDLVLLYVPTIIPKLLGYEQERWHKIIIISSLGALIPDHRCAG